MDMDLRGNGSYHGYGGGGGGYGGGNYTYTPSWRKHRSGKNVSPPREVLLIFISIIQSIAILTTCFRLIHRWLRHKLWWDDCWAFIAILSDLVLFITFLISPIQGVPTRWKTYHLVRVTGWVTVISYTVALWAARLTISVTITRLLPQGPVKIVSKVVSLILVIFALVLVVHKIYFCKKAGCYDVPAYTGIIELVTDILADLWLLLAPVYMLFQMKLRPSHHRLILGIFTCGIFTTLGSIAHSVFILLKYPYWTAITGHIQVTTAIVVSNLLILVTVAYRYIQRFRQRRRENQNISEPSTSRRESTPDPSRREGEREAAPVPTDYSGESHIDLTQMSSPDGTFERRSVSFLSSAPFSSFSYSSSSRHGQSVKSGLPEFESEEIHEEPALCSQLPPIPEHGEVDSKPKTEGHGTAI